MKRDRAPRPLEKRPGPPPRLRVGPSTPELIEEIREHFPTFEAELRQNTEGGIAFEIFADDEAGARALLSVLVGLARKEFHRRANFATSKLSLIAGEDADAAAERAAIQSE